MSDAAQLRMDGDEFLVWCQDQEDTYELIDGLPVRKFDNGPEMMAGGTRNHARIAGNLIVALGTRLRGGPCYPVGGDMAVRIDRGHLRRPDVTVECARGRAGDLEAVEPKVLIEVLSPATRRLDLLRKTNEYQRVPSAMHLLTFEPEKAKALLWSRDLGGGWGVEEVTGLDAMLDLPALGVTLSMAEVYADVELTAEA